MIVFGVGVPRLDAQQSGVQWTNLVHTGVNAGTLQKITGCDGCDDGGATSAQELSAGDGYAEFVVGEMNTLWLAGLSHGNSGTAYGDIDFAFFFNGGGWAEIRENGAYQTDMPYAAGDVFRVGVTGGRVQYFKNGTLVRESARAPEYPLLLDTSLLSAGATIVDAVLAAIDPPPSGKGVLEKAGSPALRPRVTASEINAFLPPNGARGAFTFPAPYHTAGVRLTNAGDCADGQDCIWSAGYSYWRNINNHAGSSEMYIFLGMDRARGGGGPALLKYTKATDAVENLGPLFSPESPYSWSTGEGWYFSGTHPTRLYTSRVGTSELRRYDVLARQFEAAPVMDLAGCPADVCPSTAAFITQPHSSDDDVVHSATVQNGDWQRIGCVVYDSAAAAYRYFAPPDGNRMDECHVDKSGGTLVLIDSSANYTRYNRIIDLATGAVTAVDVFNGALGHLDTGHRYAVGADTHNPWPNATIVMDFPLGSTGRPIGPVVHFNKRWDIVAANHITHGNAVNGTAASQYACGSNASRVADMADEIICFPLDATRNADGSLDVLSVGQVMTDLDAAGGGDDYEQLPKGSLDVTGRYFIWTTNLGGGRLDAFLVKIPVDRLLGH